MDIKYKRTDELPRLRFTAGTLFMKLEPVMVLLVLFTVWCLAPGWLQRVDGTVGSIDQSIWLLVVLSMICFLLIIALAWWLLNRFILVSALPAFGTLVSQFNTLSLWQQLSFYWASFALLLLAALLSLVAIC